MDFVTPEPAIGAVLLLLACSSPSAPPPDGSGGGGTSGASGAPTGGTPSAGASTGGSVTGGAPTGGAPTGGGGSSGAVGGTSGTGTGGSLGGAGGVATGGGAGMPGGSGAGGATGGDAGAPGGSGGGGATGGSGGKADCSTLPLCDSFETTAVGMPPNSALWTKIPTAAGGTATIDSIGAHGSARSLKIVSPDRLYFRNSTVIGTLGPVAHVRFYVRLETALAQGHGSMIVTHPMAVDQYSQSNELRFGSQDMVFHWNTDSDAANIPDVSPSGDAASFRPVAATWYCVELTINTNGHLNTSIDGQDQPGLTADGVPTANIDMAWVGSAASLMRYTALADFNFGWQSYGSGGMTLWFDDVALSSSPIGCL